MKDQTRLEYKEIGLAIAEYLVRRGRKPNGGLKFSMHRTPSGMELEAVIDTEVCEPREAHFEIKKD